MAAQRPSNDNLLCFSLQRVQRRVQWDQRCSVSGVCAGAKTELVSCQHHYPCPCSSSSSRSGARAHAQPCKNGGRPGCSADVGQQQQQQPGAGPIVRKPPTPRLHQSRQAEAPDQSAAVSAQGGGEGPVETPVCLALSCTR